MDPLFSSIRDLILELKAAEERHLADGTYRMADGPQRKARKVLDRQRLARLQELDELLMGPARRKAVEAGWNDEAATDRMVALFNAAVIVTKWTDYDAAIRDIQGHNDACHYANSRHTFKVDLEEDPQGRLSALLTNLDSALEAVMRLAGSLTTNTQGTEDTERAEDEMPQERHTPVELNETELAIWNLLAAGPLRAKAIAHRVRRTEDHIRSVLASMIKRAVLKHGRRGYSRVD